MKVLVLGGGVVGVTTAYYLARDGHEVTVVERHSAAAAETSCANAGLLAPAHAYAWASPKAPRNSPQVALHEGSGTAAQAEGGSAHVALGIAIPRPVHRGAGEDQHAPQGCGCACTRSNGLNEVVADTGVEYERSGEGQTSTSTAPSGAWRRESRIPPSCASRESGLQVLDRDAIAGIEPALEPAREPVRGRAPRDGRSERGTRGCSPANLAAHCTEHLGVRFEYGTRAAAIVASADRIERVTTDRGDRTADAVRAGGRTRVAISWPPRSE